MIISKISAYSALLSVLIANAIGMAIYSYVPPYLLYLGVEISIIQLIVVVFPLTSFIFPPLLGKLSDKAGNRIIFISIGIIGMIFTFFVLLFIKDPLFITLLLLMYGFFSASYGMIFVLYAELVENDENYISFYNASVSLGWFIGAIFGGYFIDTFGINDIFYYFLILAFFNIVFIFLIKEERETILNRYYESQKIHIEGLNLNEKKENKGEVEIPKSLYAGLYFRNFGVRPILSVLAIIMAFHLTSDTEIGFLIGINPLIQFFLMILIGRLITEHNIRKMIIIGYLLNIVVIFGYIFSTNFLGYLLCQILISFGFSMFWNATYIYISKQTTPKNKGKYVGYANSSFFLGSLTGGLYFSYILSIYPDYFISMYFLIIFPALSALLILFFFKLPTSFRLNQHRLSKRDTSSE